MASDLKSKERKLNAGIIGLGVGERHIAGYEAHPQCQVTAVADLNEVKRKDVQSRHPHLKIHSDAHAILTDPNIDVVSIASFDNFHFEQIMTALENNKHVFKMKVIEGCDRDDINIRVR